MLRNGSLTVIAALAGAIAVDRRRGARRTARAAISTRPIATATAT